jgi:hypothetical protein
MFLLRKLLVAQIKIQSSESSLGLSFKFISELLGFFKKCVLPFAFCFGVLFFYETVAFADSLSFSRNARTFEAQQSTLLIKSLAFSCLTLNSISDGIPCNPAMTPKATKGSLKATGLISNGYSNLARTRRLLSGEVDPALINELFSDQPVLQAESNVDVMFTSKYLNAKLSPLSYKFFSVVRNQANPDVDLFAVEEQDLTLQTGYSIDQLDLGVEFKKTDWKFIRQRVKLLALTTQQGSDSIKPKNQSAYFIQPAANYNFDFSWSPKMAAKIVNLGQLDKTYDEFPHPVEVQLGVGISPPVTYGKLELMLDYKSLNYEEKDFEKLHLGVLYKYGAMDIGLGLDNNGASAGVFYGLEQINSGILFSTTKLPWKDNDYYSQTVYVQIGWQL